jgi:predicted ArsR family transcriptional regulator
MRLVFVEEFAERGELSPAGLVRALDEEFELTAKYVSSHLHPLVTAGVLKATRSRSVRGATEHFYELTALGSRIAKALRDLEASDASSRPTSTS